jgi:hypothetical protein
MHDLAHYLPEVIGGAGAYALHAVAHRAYGTAGRFTIRLVRAARRSGTPASASKLRSTPTRSQS